MNVAQIEKTPMSNFDILKYFPNVKIYMYPNLKNIKKIDELFKTENYFFLLYLDSPNSGHWVCCSKNINANELYFFDSYGYKPDTELKFNNDNVREILGTETPYLTKLFDKSKYKIFYNDFDYQGKKNESQTCGRFCCFFILNFLKGMKLDDFYNYMQLLKKQTKKSYNEIVSICINE